MLKKIYYSEIIGFLITILFGVLLHFTYDWSSQNYIVAAFSPVNESTWEHLKLLFTPMFCFFIIEYILVGRKYHNYIPAKAFGIVIGMYCITSLFYTYTGIIGQNNTILDIIIFVISSFIAHVITYYVIKNYNFYGKILSRIGIIAIIIVFTLFILFTYYPPHIPYFIDPKTLSYGI